MDLMIVTHRYIQEYWIYEEKIDNN